MITRHLARDREAATNPRAGDTWKLPDGDIRVLVRPAPGWGGDSWEMEGGKVASPSGYLRIGTTLLRRGPA